MAKRSQSSETEKYKVLTPLRHDGKHYAKGATVDLSEDDAKPLVDRKVVAAAKEAKAE